MAKKSKQSKTLPIYILNGPNLNLLGTREPEVYGYTTLAQVEQMCAKQAASHGLSISFRQSNFEGEIVEQIQEARTGSCGLIINPGTLKSVIEGNIVHGSSRALFEEDRNRHMPLDELGGR